MEPQTFDFAPDTPKLNKEMQAQLAKTEAALKQMWAREKQEEAFGSLEPTASRRSEVR